LTGHMALIHLRRLQARDIATYVGLHLHIHLLRYITLHTPPKSTYVVLAITE
jgi:hypothetical protein